ncbi:MAG: hypothetical protein ACRBF0_01955 [Calditrichia bacterium]
MKINKSFVEQPWFAALLFLGVIIWKFYDDFTWLELFFICAFGLSMVWFAISLAFILSEVQYFISTGKWNCFSSREWLSYLSSIPLLMLITHINFNIVF